ncbi:MAG: DNA cytosine methyltransferase [Saprospiraceae bacterium]|nr:DNA cytosine methyltransferase [Saprospiraceae bacterium]
MQVVLSLFTGIGMLDIGFKELGFCVVSAGDTILGEHHDIRKFKAKKGVFDGIIAGPPCQDFSKARRTAPTGEGLELLNEFCRIVEEAKPRWFIMENVPTVPNVKIDDYFVQRFDLNAKNCGSMQNRNRHFQFGSYTCDFDNELPTLILNIKRDPSPPSVSRCVTASEGKQKDRRDFADFCELQGLPQDFDLPNFNQSAKYRAVGNGVNVLVSRRIAEAVKVATEDKEYIKEHELTMYGDLCACGCGRLLTGRQKSATPNCRKRLEKKRKLEKSLNLPSTVPPDDVFKQRIEINRTARAIEKITEKYKKMYENED